MQTFQSFPFGVKLIQLPFATISYQQTTSVYENYALIDILLNKNHLDSIAQQFSAIQRVPTICFENREALKHNIDFLKLHGYTHEYHDSWLFFKDETPNPLEFHDIITVATPEQLKIFLDTFDLCYRKDDPQNPYGEVKEYLPTTKKLWLSYGNSDQVKYFIAFDNKEPVAVSALTSYKGLGYISAVGSLQKVRGKGFGKKVSLFAASISRSLGNTQHFLLTEVGSYPYEFYKRIGFIEKFVGVGMYQ